MLDAVTAELLDLTASERGRHSALYARWELVACTTSCCCVNPFSGGHGWFGR